MRTLVLPTPLLLNRISLVINTSSTTNKDTLNSGNRSSNDSSYNNRIGLIDSTTQLLLIR